MGKVNLFFPFRGNGHRGHNRVNVPVLQQGNPGPTGDGDKGTFSVGAQDLLGQGLGQVNFEAFQFAGPNVFETE